MIIKWNDEKYFLTQEKTDILFDNIEQFTIRLYEKSVPDAAKIAGQALTRGFLAMLEKNEKDKDLRLKYRPTRKQDPTIHLVHMLIEYVKKACSGIEGYVETDNHEITGLSFQIASEGRRYISSDGDKGKREDNSRQDDRQCISKDLPISQTFHS